MSASTFNAGLNISKEALTSLMNGPSDAHACRVEGPERGYIVEKIEEAINGESLVRAEVQ
jgi:hypothetical protein